MMNELHIKTDHILGVHMSKTQLIGKDAMVPLHPCFPVKAKLDGVIIHSVASFLIALTIEDASAQALACSQTPEVSSKLASRAQGVVNRGNSNGKIYWKGESISRSSQQYDNLLDRLFIQLLESSESIKRALLNTAENNLMLHPRAMRLIGHHINRDEYSRRLKGLRAGARTYETA